LARYRIAVVAPGAHIPPETAERVLALAASHYPSDALEIHFHPQCFLSQGHFAGPDEARTAAFIEAANDPGFDAVWIGRGGYGACRMAPAALAGLGPAAASKTFLGYSDGGALLGGLYRAGIGRPVHAPIPGDIIRDDGERAVLRTLRYLVDGDQTGVEGSDDAGAPRLAFNIAVLSSILGSDLEPDFTSHVLMLEEVGEYMYRLDRYLFHITSQASVRQCIGIRLGRVSQTIANVPEFGDAEEQIIELWCARAGIPYLGRADIGHDVDNKIVPFGRG
jgi:muramoyltetrapeptide carboxypeptidase